jgi:hypothetical protein
LLSLQDRVVTNSFINRRILCNYLYIYKKGFVDPGEIEDFDNFYEGAGLLCSL